MTFSQLIYILKARFRLIVLVTVVATISAIIIALVLPKKYKAINTVIFNYKVSDPISGAVLPAQLLPGYMATEVDIITSRSVLHQAINTLALNKDQETIDDFNKKADINGDGLGEGDINDWISRELLKKISATPSRRSNLIYISATDKSSEFASNLANAVSDAYLNKSVEMKVAPSRKAASFYTVQLADLQKKVEQANQEYTNFQRENNIQVFDDRDVNVETERLNELSNQLVVVQAQLAESRSRKQAAKRGGSPDIVADAVVQMHKASLAKAQENFAIVSAQYASNHPEYIAAKSQVGQARASLNRQMGAVSRSVSSSASIYKRSEAEIKLALEKQRKKVLDINKSRNELRLLKQNLTNAQKSFDAANARFIKNNFEGESNQSNVTLLSKAVPPRLPSSLSRRVIVLLGAALGALAGVLFVLISELLDRRVRSVEDMESLLDYPVFGVLPRTELRQLEADPVKSLSFKS